MSRRIISAKFDEKEMRRVDALLGRMPLELRERTLKRVVRLSAKVVEREAKRRLHSMSFPHQSDQDKFVRSTDSIAVVTRTKGEMVSSFTGPVWPAGLPAHLIEYGFEQKWVRLPSGIKVKRRAKKRIAARPFLRPAADSTKVKQKAVIVDGLKRAISKLAKA